MAGELLRLLAGHPNFALAGVLSDSQPASRSPRPFPHLAPPCCGNATFESQDANRQLIGTLPQLGLVLRGAARRGRRAHRHAADAAPRRPVRGRAWSTSRPTSALPTAAAYASGLQASARRAQPARRSSPARCPSIWQARSTPHVAHPGCFTHGDPARRCAVAGARPGSSRPLFVAAITGSTGAGRKPDRRHPPSRAAQRPVFLQRAGASPRARDRGAARRRASGVAADFAFVPHSGPFARGIHATVQARLKSAA